jgi:hypothetical protein
LCGNNILPEAGFEPTTPHQKDRSRTGATTEALTTALSAPTLGYIVNTNGVAIEKLRGRTIQDWPEPQSIHEI